MKIIVSHDVDHLFRSDHYHDLIYPKLWVRSTIEVLKREYSVKEWFYRMLTPFSKVRHHIPEVMAFDKKHGIKSTFFFGMSNGLGMSYKVEKAKDVIKYVDNNGFDVGVHGIAYNDYHEMRREHEKFSGIIGREDFGIRMHYVRFDDSTCEYLDKCDYMFDTSDFDKSVGITIKEPYKNGGLWEFPLTIMDGYLPISIDKKKKKTLEFIKKAEEANLPYLTLLFHDYQFCEGYATERDWYKWVIKWFINNGYEFISYKNAIKELEKGLIDE